MNELAPTKNCIPPMSDAAIDKVYQIETISREFPQTDIPTSHVVHGGMYARTIMIPANTMLTGALIKIATILIVQGDAIIYIGDKSIELHGYNVLPASAYRKQAFIAQTDTYLTMIFPTTAKNISDAEDEFTNESKILMSRHVNAKNQVIVTGE